MNPSVFFSAATKIVKTTCPTEKKWEKIALLMTL